MSGGPGHPQKPLAVFDLIYGRSDDDAIIAIGSRRPNRKGDVAPRYFYPLRVRDRHALLPTLFEYCIEQTQYLMPNTLHQRALMGKTDTFFREGLDREHPEYFQAKNRYVHELCAITIDLDVGRGEGLTAGQALGCVFDLCLNHKMVWPSLVALSGRGAYLMFLLRNENSISPPPNTDDNAACWKLIVNEMLHRLDSLSADPNAKRLANWFKRPGTIDTNTGNEVVYMTFGVNSLSNVPLYRLSHLMKVFGLHHEPDPMAIDVRPAQAKQLAPPTPTSIASQRSQRREPVRKVKAGKGGEPYKRRANEIELLSQHRKGIHEGLRTTTLFHYFQALRASLGMTYRSEPDGKARAHQKALAAALSLNQTFRPPPSRWRSQKSLRGEVRGAYGAECHGCE